MTDQASGVAADAAFPPLLREREGNLLDRRQRAAGVRRPGTLPFDGAVGVGLSGGGIRSATFCLGIFQSLGRLELIRKIDYVSTVSGGGYFGSFLGRMFTRKDVNVEQVERILGKNGEPRILRQLRENGRYLSPNGSGDLLVMLAAMLRNWVAIHVVILSFVLMAFLIIFSVGRSVHILWDGLGLGQDVVVTWISALLQRSTWVSPWILLPAVVFAVWVVPVGWAYWLVPEQREVRQREGSRVPPVVGAVLVLLGGVIVLSTGQAGGLRWLGGFLVVLSILSIGWLAWFRITATTEGSADSQAMRRALSDQLSKALALTIVLLAFSVIDSLGQALFAACFVPGVSTRLAAWASGGVAALSTVAAFAQKLAIHFGGSANGLRPGRTLSIAAYVGAFILVGVILTGVSVTTHAIGAGFAKPPWVDALGRRASAPGGDMHLQVDAPKSPDEYFAAVVVSSSAPSQSAVEPMRASWTDLIAPGIGIGVTLVFSLLFGWTWPFLNRSSQHALYSARLTRAYMGASNPKRWQEGVGVTEVVEGDDALPSDYWCAPPEPKSGTADTSVATGDEPSTSDRGAPLHLVNVTINETYLGESKLQQQDRKGVGMALGPCGMSVGVRHHAVMRWDEPSASVQVYPERPNDEAAVYQVFEGLNGQKFNGEVLTMGAWTGISGAAFSTGLGARTNLGLSLLTGLTNVRLGYWWWPDVVRRDMHMAPWARVFQVQAYLLSEFVSRFPGTAWRRWYLSDGGHFENLGGYELLRRRVPFMVIVDAEADPDYSFEGLATLVRKARLDFGAEISFLTEEELQAHVHADKLEFLGTIEQLRRGDWNKQPQKRKGAVQLQDEFDKSNPKRRSVAHAALAKVTYEDVGKVCWLLYIKPTLTGREPTDVASYHEGHDEFPHETTADQFFDEAQWESYRMLGEHIATLLFESAQSDPAKSAPKWRPADLFDGRAPSDKPAAAVG